MNKLKLTLLVLCGLVFIPNPAEAATSATLITNTTALFTIDFNVKADGFDYEVPVAAKYGVTYQDRVDTLGFTISGSDESGPKISVVNALVLGTSPLAGVRYQVPNGEEEMFTLFILATFTEPITEEILQAKITKFPYYLNGNRTTVHQNQLDELGSPILNATQK